MIKILGLISLIAKKGYTICGQKLLISTMQPIINLVISPKVVNQKTYNKAIDDYKKACNIEEQVKALQNIFSCLTTTNFKNLTVGIDETKGQITLFANEGFTINGEKSLTSILPLVVNLPINAIPVTQKLIEEAITTYNDINKSDIEKLTSLQKLFNGLTQENLENITVDIIINDENKGSVILIVEPGYLICGQETLSSILAPIIDLKIIAKTVSQKMINKAIDDYKKACNIEEQVKALQNIFSCLTTTNFKNLTVGIDETKGQITLFANEGFTINGEESLTSILPLVVNLPITAIPVTQKLIEEAITTYNDLNKLDSEKLTYLQKLFNGLTQENFENIIVDIIINDENKGSVILIAEPGYLICGQETLSSVLAPIIDLKIIPKTVSQKMINKAIDDYKKAYAKSNLEEQVKALQNIFSCLTTNNIKNVTIVADTKRGNITLFANEGFTINGEESLTYILPSIVNLPINAIPVTQKLIEEAITTYNALNKLDSEKLTSLQKLFNGLTQENLENITVDIIINDENKGSVILIAEPGYLICGKATLSSVLAPIIDLKIIAKNVSQTMIDEAVTNYNIVKPKDEEEKLKTLQTLFNGLTQENLSKITIMISKEECGWSFILIPKDGYTICGQKSLTLKLI